MNNYVSSADCVFMGRGQLLTVWAIAEGRAATAGVDAHLTGPDVMPRPIAPAGRQLT